MAEAAKNRLSAAISTINAAGGHLKSVTDAEVTGWALVLAEDARADRAIGALRDAMWNALGRPRQSPALDQVFPGGIKTYTSGSPEGQPLLMQVLHSRILSASAPQWTDAMRAGWAAEIEALRVPFDAAVKAHQPTEAAYAVANAAYRAAVRSAHARLVALKRDLLNLGLSESQVHEIIPDAGATSSRAGADSTESGSDAGGRERCSLAKLLNCLR